MTDSRSLLIKLIRLIENKTKTGKNVTGQVVAQQVIY